MRALGRAWRETVKLFGAHRKLWAPFLILALVEALMVLAIWLAPFPPFSRLLAPPIRYFFSDRVLHYPWHLWFLFHAMRHTHLITSTLLGAFLTGVVCVMVRQTHEGRPLSVRGALKSRRVRYGAVTVSWLLSWAIARAATEGVVALAPKAAWVLWAILGLSIIMQALLAYVIPAIVFNGAKWWKAFFDSVAEALRYPVTTLGVVLLPSAAVLAFALFVPDARVEQTMVQTMPEIVVAFIAARLVVWTVTDAILTVAVAHLWLFHRTPRESTARADSGARAKARARAVATA